MHWIWVNVAIKILA